MPGSAGISARAEANARATAAHAVQVPTRQRSRGAPVQGVSIEEQPVPQAHWQAAQPSA